MSKSLAYALGLVLVASGARGAGLSGLLTTPEIKEAGSRLGLGSQHRSWTAPAIPNDELGLDLGIETTFLFRQDLIGQGNGSAVLPRIIPMPRLWGAWDLPADFQVSASFSPGMLYDGVTSAGSGVQWTYLRKSEYAVALSALFSYTYANAFGDLYSHTFGFETQASRDLGVWQPYAGAGLLVGMVSVRDALAAPGVNAGPYARAAFHGYFGARVDLMAKLSFQLDFVNARAALSAMMATSF